MVFLSAPPPCRWCVAMVMTEKSHRRTADVSFRGSFSRPWGSLAVPKAAPRLLSLRGSRQPPVSSSGIVGWIATHVQLHSKPHQVCATAGAAFLRCQRVQALHRGLGTLHGLGGSLAWAHDPLHPFQRETAARVGPGRPSRCPDQSSKVGGALVAYVTQGQGERLAAQEDQLAPLFGGCRG